MQYSYTPERWLESITKADGTVHSFEYDKAGSLLTQNVGDGQTFQSSYNEIGMVTEVSSTEGTIVYLYNERGYLISVENVNGDMVSYTYDAYGNKTSMTYPDGRVVSYTYDSMNRMTRVTGLDGDVTRYAYDAAGRRIKTSSSSLTTVYGYDSVGNLLTQATSGASEIAFSYSYNKNGYITGEVRTEGGKTTESTYAYDALGQLTSFLQSTGYGEQYTYDRAGNMTEKVLTGTDGIETALKMSYNKGNQLTYHPNIFVFIDNEPSKDEYDHVYIVVENLKDKDTGEVYPIGLLGIGGSNVGLQTYDAYEWYQRKLGQMNCLWNATPKKQTKGGSSMKHCTLNVLTMLLLLTFVLSGSSLAEECQVYAEQGDVAFFKENGKVGLQSTDGIVLHTAEFDGAGYFDATQQANIYVDDKLGRIDRSGRIIVEPFACDEIEAIPTNCASEAVPPYVLLVSWYGADGEKVMQLMNTEGEWISDTKFDLMMYEFKNGKLFIRYGDQYNQIDTNGQLTSEVWWEYLFVATGYKAEAYESFDRGYLSFTKDGDPWQQIVYQPTGRTEVYLVQGEKRHLAPETWTNFEWLSDQLVAYCENDLWGIADYECNVIMPAQWPSAPLVGSLEEDIWRVTDPGTNKWKWIHSDGETVLSLEPGETLFYEADNRYTLNGDESTKLIDNTGKLIAEIDSNYSITWFEENQYFRFVNYGDGTWGYLSMDGKTLSTFPETIYPYHDGYNELTNGWIRVIDDEWEFDSDAGQCGFVSVNGDIVLSSEWDAAYDFTANMLARVEVDGRYGYVDTTGAYVIEPQWEYADDFINADGQWIAAVYKYSGSEVVWKGYLNEANELIGEIAY